MINDWQKYQIPGNDRDIIWYELGEGPEVLFLHGNWDLVMYMPMLEAQQRHFRTLLLKQRGADCWKSPETFNRLPIAPFLDDIERLRRHKGVDKLIVVGHSWGAQLALHYASAFPNHVTKLVAIGLGPISDEMSQYYHANVEKMVHPDKFPQLEAINQRFKAEFASGQGVSEAVDTAYADVYSTVWAYSPEAAQRIKTDYLNAGGFRRVAAGAPRSDPEVFLKGLKQIGCPTLIVYGYQDYEPITQAYVLKAHFQNAEIAFINRCGHMPWLDQPDTFYRLLDEFINRR